MNHKIFFLITVLLAFLSCKPHAAKTIDTLPATTLWHDNEAPAAAENHFDNEIQQNYPHNLEFPKPIEGEDIITYLAYTSSYNHTTLVPNWVAYELTDQEAQGQLSIKCSFSRDRNVKGRQASREDYSNSGYDKGHMAPRADMKWSEQAIRESYLFPNICPQEHTMNAQYWGATEKLARKMAQQYKKVWIVCGPIFTKHQYGTIGDAQVQVPDSFFKALLIHDGQQYHSIAFVIENCAKKQKLKNCYLTVDELENLLGRDLFFNLPDDIEEQSEASVALSLWGI